MQGRILRTGLLSPLDPSQTSPDEGAWGLTRRHRARGPARTAASPRLGAAPAYTIAPSVAPPICLGSLLSRTDSPESQIRGIRNSWTCHDLHPKFNDSLWIGQRVRILRVQCAREPHELETTKRNGPMTEENKPKRSGKGKAAMESSRPGPLSSEILIYQTEDGQTRLETRMVGESVWLSLTQMAQLFQRDKSVISRHIRNIFHEAELEREATVARFATVRQEGNREVTREVEFFNLDVIISVGYRVKSHRGVQFRIWATHRLREYIIKGFAQSVRRARRIPCRPPRRSFARGEAFPRSGYRDEEDREGQEQETQGQGVRQRIGLLSGVTLKRARSYE